MAKLHGQIGLAGAAYELERATFEHRPMAQQCRIPDSGPSENTTWWLPGQTVLISFTCRVQLLSRFTSAHAAQHQVPPLAMETLHWAQIQKFQDWKVLPARAISPREHFVKTQDAADSQVPLFWPTGPERPMLEYAAENGYPGVPLSILKLLLKEEFGQNLDAHDQGQTGQVQASRRSFGARRRKQQTCWR